MKIYTIAYDIKDRSAYKVMQQCASSTDHAFYVYAGGSLKTPVQKITREISKLRYTWPEGGLQAGKDA